MAISNINSLSLDPSGGFPASATATVATEQGTTSATFTDLTTAGPAVTLTTGTKALVTFTSYSYNQTEGAGMAMSFAVSGATTVAASDTTASFNQPNGTVKADANRYSVTTLVTGLTAGSNTFTAKYKKTDVASTALFKDRQILVIDMGS